jgi:hypothetical protein
MFASHVAASDTLPRDVCGKRNIEFTPLEPKPRVVWGELYTLTLLEDSRTLAELSVRYRSSDMKDFGIGGETRVLQVGDHQFRYRPSYGTDTGTSWSSSFSAVGYIIQKNSPSAHTIGRMVTRSSDDRLIVADVKYSGLRDDLAVLADFYCIYFLGLNEGSSK